METQGFLLDVSSAVEGVFGRLRGLFMESQTFLPDVSSAVKGELGRLRLLLELAELCFIFDFPGE